MELASWVSFAAFHRVWQGVIPEKLSTTGSLQSSCSGHQDSSVSEPPPSNLTGFSPNHFMEILAFPKVRYLATPVSLSYWWFWVHCLLTNETALSPVNTNLPKAAEVTSPYVLPKAVFSQSLWIPIHSNLASFDSSDLSSTDLASVHGLSNSSSLFWSSYCLQGCKTSFVLP